MSSWGSPPVAQIPNLNRYTIIIIKQYSPIQPQDEWQAAKERTSVTDGWFIFIYHSSAEYVVRVVQKSDNDGDVVVVAEDPADPE